MSSAVLCGPTDNARSTASRWAVTWRPCCRSSPSLSLPTGVGGDTRRTLGPMLESVQIWLHTSFPACGGAPSYHPETHTQPGGSSTMHRFSRLARLVAVPVLAAGMIASLSVQAGADPAHPDKVKPKKSYVLTAQMTGAQETPPVDTDLTGVATVLIDKHFRSFCYT